MTLHQPIESRLLPGRGVIPSSGELQSLDWDFAGRSAQSDLEGLHPYPARFIPEIPAAVLDQFRPQLGTAVLDPFVGSGTTLVECQKRGIRSVGVDLNPIACLISSVKTQPFALGLDAVVDQVIRTARQFCTVELPRIPNVDHWFDKPIQQVIARLIKSINKAPPKFRSPLRLALSSILVRVSNQDSDTRYAAVRKNVSVENVYAAFLSSCRRIDVALLGRGYYLEKTSVLQRNTLALSASDFNVPIGAVITSPPYPNAYEYWLYHKYRMWWLGYDPIAVKDKEIGARAHFFKTNHHTSNNFVEQMRKTFELISSVLIPGGYVCFVVGRSKIHGELVDNAAIVQQVAKPFGFRTAFQTERIIATTRKSFNLSHANIKTETVLVLKR